MTVTVEQAFNILQYFCINVTCYHCRTICCGTPFLLCVCRYLGTCRVRVISKYISVIVSCKIVSDYQPAVWQAVILSHTGMCRISENGVAACCLILFRCWYFSSTVTEYTSDHSFWHIEELLLLSSYVFCNRPFAFPRCDTWVTLSVYGYSWNYVAPNLRVGLSSCVFYFVTNCPFASPRFDNLVKLKSLYN